MAGESDSVSSSSSSTATWFSKLCGSARRVKEPSEICGTGEGLVRRLGAFDLVVIGVGVMIGSGIFVLTGTVANTAGPGVILSFILAGAACVLNALCYAELASRFPAVVGGSYMYTYAAFNELTAFLALAQLLPDCHIAAASVARSLASYLVTILELFPLFNGKIPNWMGVGGEELFGGAISINVLAPILIALLTMLLCRGVKESSALNSFMTVIKVLILLFIIIIGAFEVDISNWSPFVPNGPKAILSGATVVFFAYLGFDTVAMTAEESKRPQRDLPIGILVSVSICAILYIGVSLVITGMVPYKFLGVDAPLAEAFASKGLKFVSVLISIGSAAGLTTALLLALYGQARLYIVLGRDGFLPSIFAKIHPISHTPVHSQVWVGIAAAILAGLFDVSALSQSFTVGSLIGYAVVCACAVTLRWEDKAPNQGSTRWISNWQEGVIFLLTIAACGFGTGLCFRFSASPIILFISLLIATLAMITLCYRQVYVDPPGFSCPGVPFIPAIGIFFNMFLFAQLQYVAWFRFVIVGVISIGFYAFYGQYHADPVSLDETAVYHRVPAEAP